MNKKNIALIAGGFTGESVISIKTADVIASHINVDLYTVYRIYIDKTGWYAIFEDNRVEVDKNDFSININSEKITFDLAFIAIHGTPGEDGKLQGYFELLNIPHNTSDSCISAITMNKSYTKSVVKDIPHLHIARSLQLFKENKYSVDEILNQLTLPVFIKPNNGGSSIGMSKVKLKEQLPEAMDKAFSEDEQIIIEEFISGREFSIGAVKLDGIIQVLPITEIISSKEFFDYEAKYTPGITDEITPAENLTRIQQETIHQLIKDIYIRLNCRGVVRTDLILEEKSGNFYFLEINTIPGQSENSIVPRQIRSMGQSMSEFYGNLIAESLK